MELPLVKLDLYKFENITRLIIMELPPLKLHLAKKYTKYGLYRRQALQKGCCTDIALNEENN